MLRLRTKVTTSPTAWRRRSSATSATARTSGPLAPNRATSSSSPGSWPAATPASTSPTRPPAAGVGKLAGSISMGGGDGPQVVLRRRRGRAGHGRARLGAEVLDDHLLDVAVAAVDGLDGGQRLQPLGPGLADADQDPGGEGDGQLPRRLQGGQPAG